MFQAVQQGFGDLAARCLRAPARSRQRQNPATALPMRLCVHAEMAQGTAVRGSEKCASARYAPSALFCMPTCGQLRDVGRHRQEKRGHVVQWHPVPR